MHEMRVGKRGLDEGVINEIKRQLEEKGEVKIKFLKNIVRNKKEFEEMVGKLLEAIENIVIVKKIGHTVIIRKKEKRAKKNL